MAFFRCRCVATVGSKTGQPAARGRSAASLFIQSAGLNRKTAAEPAKTGPLRPGPQKLHIGLLSRWARRQRSKLDFGPWHLRRRPHVLFTLICLSLDRFHRVRVGRSAQGRGRPSRCSMTKISAWRICLPAKHRAKAKHPSESGSPEGKPRGRIRHARDGIRSVGGVACQCQPSGVILLIGGATAPRRVLDVPDAVMEYAVLIEESDEGDNHEDADS